MCLSNEESREEEEDEDEEICQPIKKARTKAKRARKPKVIFHSNPVPSEINN